MGIVKKRSLLYYTFLAMPLFSVSFVPKSLPATKTASSVAFDEIYTFLCKEFKD
jgi:hypothetical protein